MKKNVASQVIGAQLVSATDGSAFTGTASVAVTVDGGTQASGGGTGPTHEGNGFHSYLPTQAETNGDHVAFTFTGTGAVPVTVQVYTTFPQTGDNFARLGAPAGASVSADIAAVKVDTAAILVDTGTTGVQVADKTGYSLTAITGLGNQTANITGNLSGSVGSVTGAVGSVTGNVGGNVVGSVASVTGNINTAAGTIQTLDALDTAQDTQHSTTQGLVTTVDTVVDSILSLLDDARGEPAQGAPPVNPDAVTKIDYLYKAWRNKKDNDGTTTNLYADDTTTVDHKQTTSEAAGTVTKGEWVSGP